MKPAYIIIASLIYSVIRYKGYEPQNFDKLPAFICNKGISMAAVILLAWAAALQAKGRAAEAARVAKTFLTCTIIHVILSLIILRPDYFKEFFLTKDGKLQTALTFTAELMVLAGATCLTTIWLNRQGHKTSLVLALAFTHVTCMGILRGLHFTAEFFYLPPMWLLSLIAIAIGLYFSLKRSHSKSS